MTLFHLQSVFCAVNSINCLNAMGKTSGDEVKGLRLHRRSVVCETTSGRISEQNVEQNES